MTWIEQSQQAVEAWMAAQQEAWQNALRTADAARAHQAAEETRTQIAQWEDAVNQAFEAQAQWTQQWAQTLTEAPGTPEFLVEQVVRIQDLVAKWTDAQRQIYAKSLEALREQHAEADAATLERVSTEANAAWDEAVAKAGEAQQRWLQALASASKAPDADASHAPKE